MTEGGVSIALEFMNAGNLATIMQKVNPIPEVILGLITLQLLKGLDYLHREQKVIHRDIKPANVLLSTSGAVKIADFGVSSNLRSPFDAVSKYTGTVLYMSPERIEDKSYYFDVDLWSLGILLVEAATGRYPYLDSVPNA